MRFHADMRVICILIYAVNAVYAHTGVHFCLTCSHRELTKDHVLTSAYVKISRTVTRNAVNKSV